MDCPFQHYDEADLTTGRVRRPSRATFRGRRGLLFTCM